MHNVSGKKTHFSLHTVRIDCEFSTDEYQVKKNNKKKISRDTGIAPRSVEFILHFII